MSITKTANSYDRNGMEVAPVADFGYGANPYDPDLQPILYNQWEGQHQGDAQQVGQDYSGKRVGGIIAGTVGAGAIGDLLAAGGAAGAAGGAGGGATSGAGGMLGDMGALGVGAGSGAAPAAGVGSALGIAGKLAGSSMLPNLIGGIASGIEGAYESGKNRDLAQRQLDQQLALQREHLAQNEKQFEASQAQNQAQFTGTQDRLYGGQALAATQMDPFKQAKSREGQALLASLLSTGYQPGGLKNVMTPEGLAGAGRFATPDAMAANEAAFAANAGKASGGQYVAPNASQVGYGGGGGGGGLAALLAMLQPKTAGGSQ